MLWRTHIRIINEVLYKLGMPMSSVEATRLREGLLTPDKWKDYPHHYGKSSKIRKYIMEARRLFLSGNLSNAFFSLGVALHYIQDSYTSLTSRSRYHERWEQQIDRSPFVENIEELVAWAFRNREHRRKEYMEILGFLSMEIEGRDDTIKLATLRGHEPLFSWGRPWGTPEVDLNFAFRASLLVAKSVLSPRICSKLQKELSHVLVEYKAMLRETETIFADIIVQLIKKRDGLEKRASECKSSIFSTLKSYFLTFLIKIHNLRIELRIKEYEQQKHLKKIAKTYYRTAQKICAPYSDWYSITIPEIDISILEKELLPMQEASGYFGMHESVIQDLVKKGKISCYYVRNKELIRRSEIEEVLRD